MRRRGAERTLAILAPGIATEYRRLVAVAAPRIEAALGDRVLANRVARTSVRPPELHLRPWRLERWLFADRLARLASASATIAFTDVRDCYACIGPALVRSELEAIGAPGAEALEGFLAALAGEGIRGLPVGPDPSAVLANAVLSHVDRALRREGIDHLRWVDDVVLAASDPGRARQGLELVRRALGELGLRVNADKARVVAHPGRVAFEVSGGHGS